MNSVAYLAAYQGARVLITGHTGFKGGWLTIWLKLLGADVYGLALPPEQGPSLYTLAGVDRGVHSMFGDIRVLDDVNDAFIAAQPDLVFHLAAQPLVRRSYARPVETYATNVMGTVHVLEAARRTPCVRGVVIVTSDKCYQNRETLWSYREGDPLGGVDPYSSSKGCAELATAAYRHSFFNGGGFALVASARAGNVFGGGDWSEDRLVPDIARAIGDGRPVVIRNPDSVRPWQHVLEPLRGYLMLGAQLFVGQADFAQEWNFGPDESEAVSVQQLVERIIRVWGQGSIEVEVDPGAPHEARLLNLDVTKARALLGYRPVLDLEQSIDLTVDWYRRCQATPERVRAITDGQIADYVELLK